MGWTVSWRDTAKKQLEKLDKPGQIRIVRYLKERVLAAGNPRIFGKPLRSNLKGLWQWGIAGKCMNRNRRIVACGVALLAGMGILCCVPAAAQEQPLFPSASPGQIQAQPAPPPQPEPAQPAQAGGDEDRPMLVPLVPPPAFNGQAAASRVPPPVEAEDPSLSTHEAAVECAVALLVLQHASLRNPADAAFQAGECTGKIQTYMLRAKEENPACFPKMALEDGINLFVTWADKNLGEGVTEYPAGIQKAFEEAIPCLKK